VEVAVDAEIVSAEKARVLIKEADELTAIFVASLKTAKQQ
jgi:hypothetical protein